MSEIEASARLSSVLAVLEHESEALRDIADERLNNVLVSMTNLRGQIEIALSELARDEPNGHAATQ